MELNNLVYPFIASLICILLSGNIFFVKRLVQQIYENGHKLQKTEERARSVEILLSEIRRQFEVVGKLDDAVRKLELEIERLKERVSPK